MCGIAGAVSFRADRPVEPESVGRMLERLAHRGPDGSGIWTDEPRSACIGHRRLSVIDLATGAQPMRDEASGVVITFNGEIYNYIELRRQLEARGIAFRTDSDTEVLMRAYIEMGRDFVHELRGMFAFGLWDPRSGSLLLVRDRIGKKPLYFSHRDGIVHFASTLGALEAGAGLAADVDVSEMAAFLTLGYVPAPRTIHPLVSKLAAATMAAFDADGAEIHEYWSPAAAQEPFEGSWDSAVDRLDELINAAVSIRLRSDVPLGVFLSGGVDSSLVAAVAARCSPTPIVAFSVGFGKGGFDEVGHAARVARQIGAEHHVFEANVDALDLLPRVATHFGEPFGDPSAAPTWVLAENARRHVTVAVGGDGGDESFGGYGWYGTAARIARLSESVPGGVARFGSAALASTGAAFGIAGRAARASRLIAAPAAHRFAALRSLIDPNLARRLFQPAMLDAYESQQTRLQDTVDACYAEASGSELRRMRCVDIRTYLADCLMPKIDVASMAHGLEARAPLLDHAIMEFGLSLPDEWINGSGGSKRILRAVLARYLPAEWFDRPKQGFDMPLGDWFTRDLRPRVSRLVHSEALQRTGWFRMDAIERMLREHMEGGRDHTDRLYNLLVLEEWIAARSA